MPGHGFVFVASSLDSIILVLAGIALVFAGIDAARIITGFILAIVLAVGLYTLGSSLGIIVAIILGFLGFVIGLTVGFALFKAAVSLVGGFLLADVIVSVFSIRPPSGLAVFILGIVLAAALYVVAEYIIAVAVVASGSIIAYAGLSYWLPASVAAIAALALFIAGLAHNWSKITERKES